MQPAVQAAAVTPTGTAIDGSAQEHPGRGKYLIKIGHRMGVPAQLALTAAERVLYDTDGAMRLSGARRQAESAA